LIEQISAIYNFVIENITYDTELAKTVKNPYLPDIDKTLKTKKGICFDYAALMTAMLRSQGIPCKLVIGFAGDVYHAWINAWSEETGWVNNIIVFDGKNWQLMDPTFASSANRNNNSADILRFIGDGKNYKAKFIY
jgi:transglutaminase-like putative cysteine protease